MTDNIFENNQNNESNEKNLNNESNLNDQSSQADQTSSNDQCMEDRLLLKKMLLFMRKTRIRMGGRGVPGMGPHRGMPGMPPVNGMPGPGRDIPCARPGKGMYKMGPCHEMPGVGPGPGMPPVRPESGMPPVRPESGMPPVGPAQGMPPVGVAPGMPPVGPAPGMPPMPPCRRHGKHPALSREHLLVIIGKYPEGIRQKIIAEKAGINQSSTSELIDKLESSGYIERKVDPSDKRATLLFLTEKGSARAAEVEDERNEMFRGMFAKLTAQEKQNLSDILDKLLADETV